MQFQLCFDFTSAVQILIFKYYSLAVGLLSHLYIRTGYYTGL